MIRHWGKVPVPHTVSWTDEGRFFLAKCPFFQKLALCQDQAPGSGKPLFGKPHSDRQRRAIALCRCDLCGGSMKTTTKVSLSHARVNPLGAAGPCVMQVEPMLHRDCAAESVRHCPSLRRDIRNGSLHVRQVLSWRAQCAMMSPEYVETVTGQAVVALGHAKVELMKWIDRDADWLAITPEELAA